MRIFIGERDGVCVEFEDVPAESVEVVETFCRIAVQAYREALQLAEDEPADEPSDADV